MARSLDIQRAWLCWTPWASLTLGGWGGEKVGRATSIRSEKSESRVTAAMGTSSAGGVPWSRKERTLLRVYEACELCLTHRASRSDKSAERPPEGGFGGIKEVPILIPSSSPKGQFVIHKLASFRLLVCVCDVRQARVRTVDRT